MKIFSLDAVRTAVAAAGLATALSAGADETRIDIMVSPTGTGPYLAWATLQTYAPDFSEALRPTAVETPGFVYNVRYFASNPDLWKTTLIGSGEVVEWAAANGKPPFFPEPLEAVKDFRIIGTTSQSSNLFVATDPGIKTPADFVDKRVATGLLSQNEWGMHQRLIVEGMGLMDQLDSYSPLGPNENVNALLDGRADVGTVVLHSALGLGNNLEAGPFKTLESSGRDWHYVTIDKQDIEQYISDTGAPFMIREIPAGTMSNQPDDITTIGNNVLISAHKDFPEELAYEFVKLWVEMGPTVAKYNATGGIWDEQSISNMARIAPERMHPGAMRAYEELGLLQ